MDSLRAELGPHIFAAQYQQAPVPVDGLMIERQWVQRYDRPPERGPGSFLFQSWDTATKDGDQNDYSVCTTWLYQDKKYYLIHVLRGRFNVPKLLELAISHARAHEPEMILVEDAGIAASLIDALKTAGQSVAAVKPVHDKRTRMSMRTPKFASGQVFFPTEAPWLADLEAELFAFPNSLHDDQVDSISQALAHEISEWLGRKEHRRTCAVYWGVGLQEALWRAMRRHTPTVVRADASDWRLGTRYTVF